jgi:hypothetical protein
LQDGNIDSALNILSMATGASVANEALLYAGQRMMERTVAGEISLSHATAAMAAFKPRGGERIASRMKRLHEGDFPLFVLPVRAFLGLGEGVGVHDAPLRSWPS